MTADDVMLSVRPALTDAELDALFTAAWPRYRSTRFGPVLERSLTWIAARSGDRLVGGMTWLHVDYEPHLDGFYRGCGFRPTAAGLLRLSG